MADIQPERLQVPEAMIRRAEVLDEAEKLADQTFAPIIELALYRRQQAEAAAAPVAAEQTPVADINEHRAQKATTTGQTQQEQGTYDGRSIKELTEDARRLAS